MSHEMMEHDSAAFFKKPAWHGLGNVIENPMSIDMGLEESGLNWDVLKRQIYADGIWSDSYRAIVRDDVREIIGVVNEKYKIVQNREMFELAKHFGDEARVESAGSIQNGKRAYLLLQGDSFDVGGGDLVQKYMALMWSHDGTQAAIVIPTSIRIQCKNTSDLVLGQAAKTNNKISIRHFGDIESKMGQVKDAIARFKQCGQFYEQQTRSLAKTGISQTEATKFFMEMYQSLTKTKIVLNPTTEKEEVNKVKALTTISSWNDTLEEEGNLYGFNLWIAANAVTKDIQHKVGSRGRKKSPASKAMNNLVGKNAVESAKVFNRALQMVG
jgi:phage/plasmid-like protein (TIGR03299 family)